MFTRQSRGFVSKGTSSMISHDRRSILFKLTLSALIFARTVLRFWHFPRIIIRANYHKTSHLRNLIYAKYQKKISEK